MSHNPNIKNPGEISSRFVKIDGLEAILTAIPTTLLLKNRPFFTEYNTQIHEYLPHFTVQPLVFYYNLQKKSTKSGIMSIFTHLLKKPEILIQFVPQYYIGNLPALAKNSVSALPGMHNIINLIRQQRFCATNDMDFNKTIQ